VQVQRTSASQLATTVHLVQHDNSQLAVAVQAGPRREVQLAVAVRGEQWIRTQLTQLTIPVVQGLPDSTRFLRCNT